MERETDVHLLWRGANFPITSKPFRRSVCLSATWHMIRHIMFCLLFLVYILCAFTSTPTLSSSQTALSLDVGWRADNELCFRPESGIREWRKLDCPKSIQCKNSSFCIESCVLVFLRRSVWSCFPSPRSMKATEP